ncbi:MAG TPA: diiron oxygenase, partial [Candidatus Limnocylindrales bacterium]|nr:diiron oxygenase [Candidatus Limnocylindrales bacterium]
MHARDVGPYQEPVQLRLRPGRFDHALGRFLKATATGPHMYAAILIAEEILDSFQREIMADDSLQPLIRMVSRIHVIEEARHIRFAKQELARQVEAANPVRMAYSRLVIARAAYAVVANLVQPGVYTAVGIPARVGQRAARQPPLPADAAVGGRQDCGLPERSGPHRRPRPSALDPLRPDLAPAERVQRRPEHRQAQAAQRSDSAPAHRDDGADLVGAVRLRLPHQRDHTKHRAEREAQDRGDQRPHPEPDAIARCRHI